MEDVRSTIEEVNEVTKRIKVSIPQTVVSKEFESAMGDLVRDTQIKGFRKGAAPRQIVEKMHGSRLKMEVTNRLIASSLGDVIRTNSIPMIGEPEIDIASFDEGKEIEFTADVSLFPEPKVVGYDKVVVEVTKKKVTDEDVNGLVEKMRQSKATMRKLELRNVAQRGDVLDGMVQVTQPGKEISRPEPFSVALGEGQLPEVLESGLVGLAIGESRTIEEPAEDAENARAGTKYTVTLNSLFEKVLPDLTDDFVKSLKGQAQTVLELKIQGREDLEKEAEKTTKTDTDAAVLDSLVEKNQFLVPQVLVDDEIRQLLVQFGAVDPEKVGRDFPVSGLRDKFNDVALKRVRTAILVDRIAHQENLVATKEELEAEMTKMGQEHGLSLDDVKKYFQDRNRAMRLTLDLTRDKVLAMLRDKAKVTYTDPK